MAGLLAVFEQLIRARKYRFEIAQDDIDSLKWQTTQIALSGDFDETRAACLGHRPEACQAIAEYSGAQYQI